MFTCYECGSLAKSPPSLTFPSGLTQWLPSPQRGELVPGQATAAPPSLQVPAPSPGCSSSAGPPACLSAPPTASSGPPSHLPAPSRKCVLSRPSWALRPPAQVCWVSSMEGTPPPLPPGFSSHPLCLLSPRQWLLARADAPGCRERAPADGQCNRSAALRPHSPVPACALGASCPYCRHQHSSLEVRPQEW